MTGRPLNLAMMSSQSNWGGGEQFLWSLGMGLAERGHKILWVAPPGSALKSKLDQAHSNCIAISGRNPSPMAILRLRRAIQNQAIDLLHLNDSHAVTWGTVSTFSDSSFRRVAVKHTNFPIRSSSKYNWFVDRVACVSKTVHETCLEGGILARKLHVITGSVPKSNWDRVDQRRKLVEYLGVDSKRHLVVAVGSLIACKGYDRLLRSIHELKGEHPEIFVAIFGEGPERTQLEKLITELQIGEHVRLMGFQDSPEQWIAGADLFAHSALSEGLPLVAMHAQMQGVPMVASDVGGLSEMLRCPQTGNALGWIVSDEELSLTAAISKAIKNPIRSQNMAVQAQILASRRYSLDRMITEYEEFYNSILMPASPKLEPRRKAS